MEALEKAKNLFYIKELNEWKLYGKTGSDSQINADGSHNEKRGIGWFVGWLIKGDKHIFFAQYIEDDKDETIWARSRAKEIAISKLTKLIQDLNK